jgi:hypothetical protein
LPPAARKCRRKFLRYFPNGFKDETYVDWERGYKWNAHLRWREELGEQRFRALLGEGRHDQIASTAVRIESRTNLLFSFEKMALRDAVKSADGAKLFAEGLSHLLFGRGDDERRFAAWCEVVGQLPRRQTRVLTWPVVTVFPFIAAPDRHIFLKPNVTRAAARAYDFDFTYTSRPSWPTYASLLAFARVVCREQKDLRPADLIDAQGFIWVQGSDEY